jgi:hypothetical protein
MRKTEPCLSRGRHIPEAKELGYTLNEPTLNSMDDVAALMKANLPKGMTPKQVGEVLRWGRGSAAARQRRASLTAEELRQAGITAEMANNWAAAYDAVVRLTPQKPQCGRSRGTHATRRPASRRRITVATPAVTAPVFRVRLRNPTDAALHLWIEPLGDQVTIPQHTTIEVHCSEQLGYPNEFEMSGGGITVHGWVRNVFAVSEDGELQSLWALPDA